VPLNVTNIFHIKKQHSQFANAVRAQL